jgi:hypothetical protein
MEAFVLSDLGYELLGYVFMIATAVFTVWYPKHIHARGAAAGTN